MHFQASIWQSANIKITHVLYICSPTVHFSSSPPWHNSGLYYTIKWLLSPLIWNYLCLYFLGNLDKTIRDLQSGNMSLTSLCPSCSVRLSVLSEIFEQLPVLLGWFLNVSYSGPCSPPSTCLVMVTTLVSLDLDYLLLKHWCSTDHSSLKKPCIYQTFFERY